MKLKTRPPRIFRDKKKRLYIMFDGKKRLIKSSTKIHKNELTHNKLYMIMIQKLINKAFPKPRKRKNKEEDKDVVFSKNVKATAGGNSTTTNPFQSAQDVINAKNAPSSTQQNQQLMLKNQEEEAAKQLLLEKEHKTVPLLTDIPSATPLKNKRKYQKRGFKITEIINPQLNKTKRQYINLLKK